MLSEWKWDMQNMCICCVCAHLFSAIYSCRSYMNQKYECYFCCLTIYFYLNAKCNRFYFRIQLKQCIIWIPKKNDKKHIRNDWKVLFSLSMAFHWHGVTEFVTYCTFFDFILISLSLWRRFLVLVKYLQPKNSKNYFVSRYVFVFERGYVTKSKFITFSEFFLMCWNLCIEFVVCASA